MAEDAMQLLTAPQVAERGHAHADTYEDEVMSPPLRRATDIPVSKLSFTLQMVLGAIFATASIIGGFWLVTSGLRSDVRNINTLMEAQSETIRLQRELDRERWERNSEKQQSQNDALKATVETTQKELRLLQIEFQNFRQSLSTIGRR